MTAERSGQKKYKISYASVLFMTHEDEFRAVAITDLGREAILRGEEMAIADAEFDPPKVGVELSTEKQIVNAIAALSYERIFDQHERQIWEKEPKKD